MSETQKMLIDIINKLKKEYEYLQDDILKICQENTELKNKICELEHKKTLPDELYVKRVKLNSLYGIKLIFNNNKEAIVFGNTGICKYEKSKNLGDKRGDFYIDLCKSSNYFEILDKYRYSKVPPHTYILNDDNIISNIRPFTFEVFEKILKSYNLSDRCIKNNIDHIKLCLK